VRYDVIFKFFEFYLEFPLVFDFDERVQCNGEVDVFDIFGIRHSTYIPEYLSQCNERYCKYSNHIDYCDEISSIFFNHRP
jgi:hypothetical protein